MWSEDVGPEHADTVQAVYAVFRSAFESGTALPQQLLAWLLPRAAIQWGLGHADTRAFVTHLAHMLAALEHTEPFSVLTRATYNVARYLPGGLGWGTAAAAVAPVPDEAAYHRQTDMQARAQDYRQEGKQQDMKQARELLRSCVAYCESVGPHWLCTPRKVTCMRLLASCAASLESDEAAGDLYLAAMRTARRELGRTHRATWMCMYEYARHLNRIGHHAAALPLLRKALRLQRETYGPRYYLTYTMQVRSFKTHACEWSSISCFAP